MFVSYDLLPYSTSLRIPLTLLFDTLEPSLVRTSDQVEELHVRDARGEVLLQSPSRGGTGLEKYQVWAATRPYCGGLHVEYFVPVASSHPPKRGPHIDLQAAGDGLSGAMVSFLLLPEMVGTLDIRVHWALPGKQNAVSTYGLGDFKRSLTISQLRTALFLTGSLRTFPAKPTSHGISFYALGVSGADLAQLAPWSKKAYESELRAFHGSAAEPFRFLIRSYDGGPITSGRADVETFMLYLPAQGRLASHSLHVLIAHEMVHSLIKDLDDAPGEEGDWYTEGTADYFALTLPRTAGLYDDCEYLSHINEEAASYYNNQLRLTPNQDLTSVIWSGRNAWTMPYTRGALYFANLDAQLKAHGNPLQTVDLVNETSQHIRAGARADNSAWQTVLREKAGLWAVMGWTEMMSGALIVPVPGAFTPSVQSEPISVPFFDLGFKLPQNIATGAKIEGLMPDSVAAQAGLHNGDIFRRSIDLNPFYRSLSRVIVLDISRDGENKEIEYQPYSGKHKGFHWTAASSAAGRGCSTQ